MTWPRAAAIGVGLVALAFVLLVSVPDQLLTSLSGMARSSRVAVTTAWFTVALAGLLWALRRLQARGLR